MTASSVREYLKYENLQMAAEAFFTLTPTRVPGVVHGEAFSGPIANPMLILGNTRASSWAFGKMESWLEQEPTLAPAPPLNTT